MSSFSGDIRAWVNKTKSMTRRVVGGAAQDMAEIMTTTQPSIEYTGTYVEGKLPHLTGGTVESFVVNVQGDFRGNRNLDKLFESVTSDHVDMGFMDPAADLVEYGTRYFPGRYFIRAAVAVWPEVFSYNVSYVRATYGKGV